MRIVWGLIAAFAIMVAGFWPSFFSNPAQNDLLHTVHGTLAAGWMLILIVQAWLMARGHVRIHHWIGRLSILWVAALLYTAVRIVLFGLSATGERALPMPWRPILTLIDLPSLLLFAGLYTAAIYCAFKRKVDDHYRLMICTVIVVIVPALGRLLAPVFHGLLPALHPTFWLCEATCIALIVSDFVTRRRTYAAYWVTLAGLAAIEAVMFQAEKIAPFMSLIRSLGYPA